MRELEFLMDVSPQWWIKARNNEKFLKQYVFDKFERDYYPRIVYQGRKKIDLDYDGKAIKEWDHHPGGQCIALPASKWI